MFGTEKKETETLTLADAKLTAAIRKNDRDSMVKFATYAVRRQRPDADEAAVRRAVVIQSVKWRAKPVGPFTLAVPKADRDAEVRREVP